MKNHSQLTLAVATFATFACLGSAQVTLIQENFDSYGSSNTQLSGQSGGSGFTGNWTNIGGSTNGYTNTNLAGSTTGYVNTGLSNSTSGASSNNGYNGGLGTTFSTRNIARPTAYLDTVGSTVWFSFLVRVGDTATGNNAFFKPFGNTSNNFFPAETTFWTGVYSPAGSSSFITGNSANVNGPASAANTTYLIVGRVTSAGISANDTLDIWYNPSSVTSIGALSSPNYSDSSLNYTANTNFMSGISVAARGSSVSLLDSVRLAYGGTDAANFAAVITGSAIPEPSSFAALAGLGVWGLATSRRRRRAC